MKPAACAHPKESRSLMYGYDVYCLACETTIGRVALFPCAVLDPGQAAAVLGALPASDESSALREARHRLELTVERAPA